MTFSSLTLDFSIIFLALHLLFRIEILDDNHSVTAYPVYPVCQRLIWSLLTAILHTIVHFLWSLFLFIYVVVGGRFKKRNKKKPIATTWESSHVCSCYCKTFVYCNSWLCLHHGLQLSFPTVSEALKCSVLMFWNDTFTNVELTSCTIYVSALECPFTRQTCRLLCQSICIDLNVMLMHKYRIVGLNHIVATVSLVEFRFSSST